MLRPESTGFSGGLASQLDSARLRKLPQVFRVLLAPLPELEQENQYPSKLRIWQVLPRTVLLLSMRQVLSSFYGWRKISKLHWNALGRGAICLLRRFFCSLSISQCFVSFHLSSSNQPFRAEPHGFNFYRFALQRSPAISDSSLIF